MSGSGGFASGFSAVHGALSRNAQLADEEERLGYIRQAQKRESDDIEQNTRLAQETGVAQRPGEEMSDFVSRMVGSVPTTPSAPTRATTPNQPAAPTSGAVGGALAPTQPASGATPSANPLEAPLAMLRDIRATEPAGAPEGTPGAEGADGLPRSQGMRARFNAYAAARIGMAAGLPPERQRQVLAGIEEMRRTGTNSSLALAYAAAQNGDATGAARALTMAGQFLPSGTEDIFTPTPDGRGLILNRRNESTGEAFPPVTIPLQTTGMQAGVGAGSRGAADYILAMMDPKWQANYIEQRQTGEVSRRTALDANARGNAAEGRAATEFREGRTAGERLADLQIAQRALRALPADATPEQRQAAMAAVEEAQQRYDRAALPTGRAVALEGIGEQRRTTADTQADREAALAGGAVQAELATARAELDRMGESDPNRAAALARVQALEARFRQAAGRTPAASSAVTGALTADETLATRQGSRAQTEQLGRVAAELEIAERRRLAAVGEEAARLDAEINRLRDEQTRLQAQQPTQARAVQGVLTTTADDVAVRDANAAFISLQSAQRAYAQNQTPENERALRSAEQRAEQLMGRLTPQQSAPLQQAMQRSEALQAQTERAQARIKVREAELEVTRARDTDSRRAAEARLEVARRMASAAETRARAASERAGQRAGLTAAEVRNVATDTNTVLDSNPVGQTEQGDFIRFYMPSIFAANRNVSGASPDALTRAMIPFMQNPSQFPVTEGRITVNGRTVVLPDIVQQELIDREQRARAAAASQSERVGSGTGLGAISNPMRFFSDRAARATEEAARQSGGSAPAQPSPGAPPVGAPGTPGATPPPRGAVTGQLPARGNTPPAGPTNEQIAERAREMARRERPNEAPYESGPRWNRFRNAAEAELRSEMRGNR